MNKKIPALLFAFSTSISLIHALDDVSSIYLIPKPSFDAVSLQRSSWDKMSCTKQKHGCAVQGLFFGQTSVKATNNSTYFLYENKEKLVIATGGVTGNANAFDALNFSRDILSQWLVPTSDKSLNGSLALAPKHTAIGVMLEASQDLNRFLNWSFFDILAVGVALPVTHLTNKLEVFGDQTVLQAFQGSLESTKSWNHATITPQEQTKTGIENITLKLHSTYENQHDVLLSTTSSLIIPLHTTFENRYLFEPTQSYNGHVGIGSHLLIQFPLFKKEDNPARLNFFLSAENKSFFSATQKRTFDLKNKPFSRYMRLLDRHTNELKSGVNVLTQECCVQPYHHFNFATGLRFSYHDSIAEIGYEIWGKPTEGISLKKATQWDNARYAIPLVKDDGTAVTESSGQHLILSASKSTINYVAAGDDSAGTPSAANNTYIQATDLDAKSAASRGTLVHRGYISLSLGHKGAKQDHFINIGAFIEQTQNNAALPGWGGWLKAGWTF